MNEAEFFPLYRTSPPDETYPVGRINAPNDADFQVNITLESDGDQPGYKFENKSGKCYSKHGMKDRFSSNKNGYTIKFVIYNDNGWHFNEADPFKVSDQNVAEFYELSHINHRMFTLHIKKNTKYPENHYHAFNLYFIEETDSGKKDRWIDPDVENPPIGLYGS